MGILSIGRFIVIEVKRKANDYNNIRMVRRKCFLRDYIFLTVLTLVLIVPNAIILDAALGFFIG